MSISFTPFVQIRKLVGHRSTAGFTPAYPTHSHERTKNCHKNAHNEYKVASRNFFGFASGLLYPICV